MEFLEWILSFSFGSLGWTNFRLDSFKIFNIPKYTLWFETKWESPKPSPIFTHAESALQDNCRRFVPKIPKLVRTDALNSRVTMFAFINSGKCRT